MKKERQVRGAGRVGERVLAQPRGGEARPDGQRHQSHQLVGVGALDLPAQKFVSVCIHHHCGAAKEPRQPLARGIPGAGVLAMDDRGTARRAVPASLMPTDASGGIV